jgi:TatA/E family protein of Tat protein translocase
MDFLIALSMPGGPEWFFLIAIVILFFGAKKLPELARGLGQSFGEFRKAKEEFEREIHRSADATDTKKPIEGPAAAPATLEVKEPAEKQPHQPS